ncbi:MAG: dehydrogenase [Pelagibacteraceae bacterium BACL20 MAG-120920-bin64]|nr:MAG: dehydrogenase [Pelagibacteraceae bacterium BACL20 MAG-120920-bin64]
METLVSKLSLLILITLLLSGCSLTRSSKLWNNDKTQVNEPENIKIVLTNEASPVEEFNSNIEIDISNGNFNKDPNNNQNNAGELNYEGILNKVGKYSFSKFNDFEYLDVQPIFYNQNLIFFDDKGTIIFYDESQKTLWKKNFYTKSEKKLKPRLNFVNKDNLIIVTDDVAKYYLIDVDSGELIWEKNNIVPFNSGLKIRNDIFYAVDYKNILRAITIKDGLEQWNLKTEESLTKSNTKISIAIDESNIYFNNSIGDITAVNLNTGQLVWQLPTQNNSVSKNAFQLSNSQLVLDKKTIFLSNNKNEFYSIDTTTGLINWKNQINSILTPTVIGKFIITVSDNGYLYIIEKKTGNILRINDLYKNIKIKKRNDIKPTGFFISIGKIYLTNDDGKLIIANVNTGEILDIVKVASDKILKPLVNDNNLFLIRNGSIIRFN